MYACKDCDGKILCGDCCTKFHKHPSRSSHNPELLPNTNSSTEHSLSEPEPSCQLNTDLNTTFDITHEPSPNMWADEISPSPNTSSAIEEACMIMTLTETFNMTRFREYQKEIIKALCSGNDCLVIQPTGSGKSLCFQFPAVYMNKIALVITPTISLMQDHVNNCEKHGIKAVFLGSAQLDHHTESEVVSGESDAKVVLVTPEWISRTDKREGIKSLITKNKMCLIALDEAHLFHYWQEFRQAYKSLETLKNDFPLTPLLCLTATAPPQVENSVSKLLRSPVVIKGSIDRPNITLACEELPCMGVKKNFSHFASRVSNILQDSCGESTIIYTDFIEDVGLIMSELSSLGIDSVAYYGEMDVKSRNESFHQWKTGQVNVMVATSAFGMGINKSNIRHIIRYGVPEICAVGPKNWDVLEGMGTQLKQRCFTACQILTMLELGLKGTFTTMTTA